MRLNQVTVTQLTANGYAFTGAPIDQRWLLREARLFDPGGNRILLYWAGENRLNPPWCVETSAV